MTPTAGAPRPTRPRHAVGPALLTALAGLLGAGPASPQARAPERFFDWTRLQFAGEEYAGRRAKLLAAIRQAGGGVMLVPSAFGATQGETFRQASDFLYLTGLEVPRSVLWIDSDSGRVVLYAPARDPRWANPDRPNDFPGRDLGLDPALSEVSGIGPIAPVESLPPAVARLAGFGRVVWLDLGPAGTVPRTSPVAEEAWLPETELARALRATHADLRIANGYAEIARLRMVKSPAEVAALRRAVEVTVGALRDALGAVRPGATERELTGTFEGACRRGGAQRFPFTPIVKSGPNALWPWRILASHYDRRNRALQAGEVVIFDVGCEVDYYVSDLGRTFPVSGRFTDQQRRAVELVTAVSDAILAAVRPGSTLVELQRHALAAIPEAERRHMQTGSFFGHHLGLDSGDPSLIESPLEPGMVFTVEPWYYNHESGVAAFIEDDVVVTERGVEVLTRALPRRPDQLESLTARPLPPPPPTRRTRPPGWPPARGRAP
jgi:Xaa-Pro aminopeptidase